MKNENTTDRLVTVKAGNVELEGNLCIPARAGGLVLFVHGSGSSRNSPRNRFVARAMNQAGLASLLFDLLTPSEETIDDRTGELRFDIDFLSQRVVEVTKWLGREEQTKGLSIGYFGASTGAAAALVSAALLSDRVNAVVSRGGRPDLAQSALPHVLTPTLLIVGEMDPIVIRLNQSAMRLMPDSTEKSLIIVPRATHLFEEPGTLEIVAGLAARWFKDRL